MADKDRVKRAAAEVVEGAIIGQLEPDRFNRFDFTRRMSPLTAVTAVVVQKGHRADLERWADKIKEQAEEIERNSEKEVESDGYEY